MRPTRLLIVAYAFPPAGGVSVLRSLSFARYLPRLGCRVFVLSARNPSVALRDPSLGKHIPPQVRVYRTFTPELPFTWRDRLWKGVRSDTPAPSGQPIPATKDPLWKRAARAAIHAVAAPDPQRGWVPFAFHKAKRIIQEHGIDTVLVSVPPFSGLGIGVRLKQAMPHLKLISDFRDDWPYTLKGLNAGQSPGLWDKVKGYEQRAVELSDYVVSVTPAWVEGLRCRYPSQPSGKFLYVSNGYDPEAFPTFPSDPPRRQRLVLTHAGSVQQNPVYSPSPVLDALDGLDEDEAAQLEVRLVGRVAPAAEPILRNRRVSVTRYGFVPHAEALRLIGESDILLLILGNAAGHSAKLFEYLASGRAILAVGPGGSEVQQVLQETGGGHYVEATDQAGIRDLVRQALRAWREGQPWIDHRHQAAIEAYTRPALAARLACLTGLIE